MNPNQFLHALGAERFFPTCKKKERTKPKIKQYFKLYPLNFFV